MKLSVITINYNNASGLEKTIQSVINQIFDDFEYIVIDGNSTDDSKNVILKYVNRLSYWISEPDSGVYNAMNKGIRQAKGDYLLFINSGDTLHSPSVLSDVFALNVTTDLIYGDLHRNFENHSDVVLMPNHISINHMLGDSIPHPCTFIRRNLFDKYGLYREDLRIVSDWAFFLKIIAFGNVSQTHASIIISDFEMDGLSSNPQNKNLIEKETKQVFADYFSPELLEISTNYTRFHNFYFKMPFRLIRRIAHLCQKMRSKEEWSNAMDQLYRKTPISFKAIFNKTIRNQRKDPFTIPIIIISYNRLNDLRKLIDFLFERKHKNIVIVDNMSTYPPLLEYYETLKGRVTVKIMDQNYGHLVFWKNKKLYKEYSKGYYIVTDSDIIPNDNLPSNYLDKMIELLNKNSKITKVGLALRIDNIPDTFKPKQSVVIWESQFWKNEVERDVYRADTDTTFAMYQPCYRYKYKDFYDAYRIGGNYSAIHGGWYLNTENMNDEEKFYWMTANRSSSWKVNENGELEDDLYNGIK